MLKFWKSTLWSIIILLGLLTPGEHLPDSKLFHIPHMDKVIHFCLFGILVFLMLAEGLLPGKHRFRNYQMFGAICLLFAVLTEWLQHFPWVGRDPSVYDLLADTAGLLFGSFVFRLTGDLKSLYFLRRR